MHSHDHEDDTKIARIERHKDWNPLSAKLTEHANHWATSRDLVVYIGPDGAKDLGEDAATAFYDPRDRTIEISAQYAFDKGIEHYMVDFEKCSTIRGLADYPILGGLTLHESMHAKYSTWSNPDIQKALIKKYGRNKGSQVMKIYTLLEETRIEGRGVREWNRDKGFLRASAKKLTAPPPKRDPKEPEGELNLTTVAVLILMRVPAGVLTHRDVSKLRKAIIKQMDAAGVGITGEETLKKVEAAARIFQDNSDTHTEGQEILMTQARAVYDALSPFMPKVNMPDDGHREEGEDQQQDGEGQEGEGQPQDGEGEQQGDGTQQVPSPDGKGGEMVEGTEQNGQLSGEAADAAEESMDNAELGGADDVWTEQARQEAERQAREAEKQAEQQKEHERKSNNTFERSSGQNGRTKSRIVSQRNPTQVELQSMVMFNAALQDARHRDRKVGVTTDYVPPGRLKTSAALRDEAVRWSGGAAGTTQMFKGKRRTHVDEPNLTVGIICDISGSMSGTMEPMAVATWVMANSVNRIEGSTCASVYYGETVFPTLWPGERLDKVTKYNADDGFEEFNAAFQAIDGKLKLLKGDGVRLLVIVSDGNYRPHEEKACRKWLDECVKNGVGVLWLGLKHGRAESYIKELGPGGEFVHIGEGVTDAIGAISEAALRALRAV